ncbi:MAG TPA: DUF1643 domain-containing protein [Burkholderiaceae bacterium]
MSDRDLNITAVFSDCGRFRHILRACWDSSRPTLGWICLNPSQAGRPGGDGFVVGDPSVRKMAGFSADNGYGGLVLANLFDFIATDPREMKAAGYPRSPNADDWIRTAAREAGGHVVCAWGTNARKLSRPTEVLALLRSAGARTMALRLTDDGIPWHPLMLPYSCKLVDLEVRG